MAVKPAAWYAAKIRSRRDKMLLYIGSYTQPPAGKALGIHALRLDHATGALTQLGVAAGINNPSYVALDPARRFLYAVNELHPAGTVSAFAVAPVSGELTFLNRRPTHGADPCHIAVDRQRRHVFVANYSSGSVCVLPVREDGSLGEASDFIQHVGAGIHPQRQTGPHVHSVTLDQIGRFAYVADLGLDKLFIYRVDTKRGMLEANSTPWIKLRPGSGPRHLALHTRGFAYLVNELDSTVRAMALNRTTGGLREVQTVSTLPDGIYRPEHLRRHPRLRQLRLRLQPRPRQHRQLSHRSAHRPIDAAGTRGHAGPHTSWLRYRSNRQISRGGQPEQRLRCQFPDRSANRPATADGPCRRGGDADLREIRRVTTRQRA